MLSPLPMTGPPPVADDPTRRSRLLAVVHHAVGAVEPAAATAGHIGALLPDSGTVTVVAIGKAAPAMTRGALTGIDPDRLGEVLVISDHPEALPSNAELLLGSHPVPDRASFHAGDRALEVAEAADGFVVFLISGGGSALAEVPADGVDVAELAALYAAMLRSGAPIEAMNTVRIHLSGLKGGRLAAALAPGVGHATVVLSDVGSDPSLVASAPTIATATTPAEATDVLHRWQLWDDTGATLRRCLEDGRPTATPTPGPVVLAGDGRLAAEAAAEAAGRAGMAVRVATTALAGIATEAAAALVADMGGELLVAAGETTVEVRGSGLGGRNQEAALAAAIALHGTSGAFVAFGTDGIDGPTDAAGAYVDGGTLDRMLAAGVDPAAALADNDSHRALEAAGALIRTGPTGVNVADLWLFDPGK